MELKLECPACGQHLSATRAQMGVTAPCPNCNAVVTVPKTSASPVPVSVPLIRFACASCGQHISAAHAQIGVTAPCPKCNVAVTVPEISTLSHPPRRPREIKAPPQKKRFETTVILIRDSAGMLDKPEKLTKWTNDFTDALDWLILKLGTLRSEQYFANVFDHRQKRSVLKETRQGGPSAY